MKRTPLFLTAGIALSLLSGPAVYASPVTIASPLHALLGRSKSDLVKCKLRNDTGVKMDVKVGDQAMTLDPGKPVNLEVPVGTRIVAANDTPGHEAGSLISQVDKIHSGNTICIH